MATIHFLNVGEGDCIVVQHNSDRVSMIDISCGNITEIEEVDSSTKCAAVNGSVKDLMRGFEPQSFTRSVV